MCDSETVNEVAHEAPDFAVPILGRRATRDFVMAIVITQLATPRKIKLAILTLLFFAAMC
jgi:hypothetical protein